MEHNYKRRRLTFLGHILRLHHDTPVRKLLNECIKESSNKRGRPANTWLRTIKTDLATGNIFINLNDPNTINTLEALASDRKEWNICKKTLMQ